MAVAEHAQLIVDIKLNDGLSAGIRKAQADMRTLSETTLPKLQAAIQKVGAGGTKSPWLGWKNEAILAVGRVKDAVGNLGDNMRQSFSKIGSSLTQSLSGAANKVRGLFSNLGKSIKQGIGLGIGFSLTNQIAGAIGQVSSFFTEATGKAEAFGVASSNLAKLLNLPIEQASALTDTLDKFGISASDSITAFGMLERNVGKYAKTAADAAKFQKQFGLSLTDSKGALASPIELLKRTVAFWNSNATATQKATALQALYGRGWKTLLPILTLGAKKFNDEFSGGIKLTQAQTQALRDAAVAQKDLNDALGDLQIAIGARLSPIVATLARQLAKLIDDNQSKIAGAVEGVVNFAKEVGGAISALAPIGRSIADAWNAIPEGLRKLLLVGFVGNKVLKMTIGFDPLDIVRKGITGAIGGLFSRGSPTNPMFTKEVGLPGGLPNVGTTTGLTALLRGLGAVAIGTAIGGLIIEGSQQVIKAFMPEANYKASITPGTPQYNQIANARNPYAHMTGGPSDTLSPAQIRALAEGFKSAGYTGFEGRGSGFRPPRLTPGSAGYTGFEGQGGGFRAPGSVMGTADSWTKVTKALDVLHKDFLANNALLKTATSPADIAAAVAKVVADLVKGVGNVATTQDVLTTLKAQLAAAKDPTLRRTLQAAIKDVERKLMGREWIAAQKQAAEKIVRSNESSSRKIAELQRIQNALLARGDTKAAAIIAAKIESLKPHIDSIAAKISISVNRLNTGGITARPNPRGPQNRPNTGTGGDIYTIPGPKNKRADGGPVWRGIWSVGENGPEILNMYGNGMGYVTPIRRPRPAYAPPQQTNINVRVSTTHRDTSNAATLHNRYGATASGAGAR